MSRVARAREAAVALAAEDYDKGWWLDRSSSAIADEVDRRAGMRMDRDEAVEAVQAYDDWLADNHDTCRRWA